MNTNNYLPFDLETALKHPERVVTRDGRKVEQIHFFKRDTETKHPIYAILDGNVEHWNNGGIFCRNTKSDYDLFLLPEVKECWVNVYETKHGTLATYNFDTLDNAQRASRADSYLLSCYLTYIKTIRITNEPE